MKPWVTALQFLGIGWYISLSIVGGALIGRWGDGKLQTGPLFTLLGLFLGLAAAVYGTYKMLPKIMRSQRN